MWNGIWFLAKRSDLPGVFVRLTLMAIALSLMLIMVWGGLIIGGFLIGGVDPGQVISAQAAYAIVLGCSLVSLLVGEFPRGDQFVIVRLSASIAARSGLLLAILIIAAGRDLLNNYFILYILAFYAIGLGVDVGLTCLKTANFVKSTTPVNS